MNRYLIFFAVYFISVAGFSQATLTYDKHTLRPGDSSQYYNIPYFSPGESGSDQVWNYSGISMKGEKITSYLPMVQGNKLKAMEDYDIILTEKDNDFYYRLNNEVFIEIGSTSKEYKLVFQDPVIKMMYPFTYGNHFSDQFSGIAETTTGHNIGFSGTYSVTADAYGTLILPDHTYQNVLRLKTETNSLEINQCATIETHSIRYLWYSADERYPLLNLTQTEYKIAGKDSDIKTTALLRAIPDQTTDNPVTVEPPADRDEGSVTVVVYPNPFDDKLNFHYFLRKSVPVSITLQDITGKTNIVLFKRQLQSEGLHTGTIDPLTYSLKPGVYSLKLIFDNQVLIRKVIKL